MSGGATLYYYIMLIGLTGQIGSGKSTAAMILKSLGAIIIDADKIGHQVVEHSKLLQKKLQKEFGRDIISKTGKVNRKKIAERAFANEAGKMRLNSIVHPYLLKELQSQINKYHKKSSIVVIDAALLLDWNYDKKINYVLVIHTSIEKRIKRLEKRGISKEDTIARQRAQLPFKEYQKRADRVILNNSTDGALREKLTTLWKSFLPKSI
ncbi:MAG: dephospho-CoA kinase [bacterium]